MRTLINVCGASFSGTTMLDLMLGNAPDAASCGEVGAWFRPRRRDRLAPNCPCGADPCPRWEPFAGVPETRFHPLAMDLWGVRILADSTKRLSWVIDVNHWGALAGIRVVNLLIWKDPVTHAYSHWKRGTPIRDARRRFVRYHERLLGLKIPFASIHFDEFTRSPAEQLAEACRAVDIPYFAGKERFWTRRHHNLFGNQGTRVQVGQAEGAVRPLQPFPDAFLAEMAAFEAGRGPDVRRQRVVDALKRFDVSVTDPGIFSKVGHGPGLVTRYWYYEHKLKKVYRDIFGRLRPARALGDAMV
ncbi:hypothetical protein P12x_000713 [Tundrisphaera lichenicola]|uniref:hypothetical protein n=1 Tax=Tundrisphaera lichenicola TaxID=2029860 RepID=UPI003EC03830